MTELLYPHRPPLLAQVRQGQTGYLVTLYMYDEDGNIECKYHSVQSADDAGWLVSTYIKQGRIVDKE